MYLIPNESCSGSRDDFHKPLLQTYMYLVTVDNPHCRTAKERKDSCFRKLSIWFSWCLFLCMTTNNAISLLSGRIALIRSPGSGVVRSGWSDGSTAAWRAQRFPCASWRTRCERSLRSRRGSAWAALPAPWRCGRGTSWSQWATYDGYGHSIRNRCWASGTVPWSDDALGCQYPSAYASWAGKREKHRAEGKQSAHRTGSEVMFSVRAEYLRRAWHIGRSGDGWTASSSSSQSSVCTLGGSSFFLYWKEYQHELVPIGKYTNRHDPYIQPSIAPCIQTNRSPQTAHINQTSST